MWYAEVADIANVNDAVVDLQCQVCSVQEGQVVTKVALVKFQAELRNETQATIQTAVAAVRTDIVGDVRISQCQDGQGQGRENAGSASKA